MSFHMVHRHYGNIPHKRESLRKIDTDPKRRLKPRAVRDGDEINSTRGGGTPRVLAASYGTSIWFLFSALPREIVPAIPALVQYFSQRFFNFVLHF